MSERLSLAELAGQVGEAAERVLEWRSLGLIGREGDEGFGREDALRARLVQLLLRRGIPLESIVQAEREIGFIGSFAVSMFLPAAGRTHSFDEAALTVGLDPAVVRRFSETSGIVQGGRLHEDDLQALGGLKVALDAGFPAEALLQLARVFGDAFGRAAEAATRLFHFYVHERLRAEGLSGLKLAAATDAARDSMRPLIEPMILYFNQKGFQRAALEDALMHLREDTGLQEPLDVLGRMRIAIVFVDLSSFTPLAEVMGDQAAAQVIERFSDLVRAAAGRSEGRVVKQLGDAFMLVFTDPRAAVACALDIEERTAGEPQFPAARSGAHWGDVLYRDGDYVGVSVNVAARLATEAERHQVLVSAALRREAAGVPGAEFAPRGRRRLKGLADEMEVFEAVRPGAGPARRLTDPVCGMELGASEPAARLAFEGEERVFCSQGCLQRFVAAPERYPGK